MLTPRSSLLALLCLCRAVAATSPVLPLSFEERDRTLFVARSSQGSVRIHPDRVVLGGITLRFLHFAHESRLEGVGPSAPSTYIGPALRRSFPLFPQLAIRGLYPGIDAIFHGNGEQLEYDLQLAPGVSPNRVRLSFEGARRLRLDERGNLIVETASGRLQQMLPRVFQTSHGIQQEVQAHYVLLSQDQVGFRLGKHDRLAPLTIDPVLVYTKYFGGTSSDAASQVATDAQGNVYVAGSSNSVDFPTTNGSAPKPTPPLIALSNSGQTVTPLPVAAENSVTAIGGTPDGNILYVATSDGIFQSTNAGAFWRQTGPLPFFQSSSLSPLTVGGIAVDVIDPARAYVATSEGLFATQNAGQDWGAIDFGLAANSDGLVSAQSVLVSSVDHKILYATTGAPGFETFLYKSIDAGGSWQLLNPTYPGEPPVGFSPNSPIVAVLAPNGSDLYVVNANATLLKSSDGGASWQKLGGRLLGTRVILLDGSNASNIYVLDDFGIQKSTDGGLTFATVTPPGLLSQDVRAIAFDAASATLYLASFSSIYVSTDQGATWKVLPSIDSSNIHALLALGGRVYASLDTPRTPFVVKWDPAGPRMLYSTFFAGTSVDSITGLSVDAQGNAVAAGFTHSQAFPFTTKLSNPSPGQFTSFVVKLSADGSNLVYSVLFGGSKGVFVRGLAIDSSGSVYITGQTPSPEFPTTSNAFQPKFPITPCTRPTDVLTFRSPNLGAHAFVSKLNPDGRSLAYSTFLTGACGGGGQGLSVNAAGEVIAVGSTTSPDFPVSSNAWQPAFPGPFNQGGPTVIFDAGFVTRLSATGDKVLASSYLGGGYHTVATAITLDSPGNATLTGATWGFAPGATPGAFQTKVSRGCAPVIGIGPSLGPFGGADAFVLKLDPSLSMAAWLTYLGGGCDDSGTVIALDPTGNTWVSGDTASADFPLSAPFQGRGNGGFVSELNGDGSRLLFSSFSDGSALALDPKGVVYLAGSSVFPTIPKLPSHVLAPSAFFAKIDPSTTPPVIIDSIEHFPSSVIPPMAVIESPAPGELIRIRGRNLGPAIRVDAQLDSFGRLPFALGTTRVLFDNLLAPLISVQDTTIVCFAPFEINQVAQVAVDFGGQRSNTVRVGIAKSAPQILAIANQDGTLNTPDHPARPGDVIVLYATGLGLTNPLSVDGMINSPPLAVPVVPVSVLVNGQRVPPQFVAAAYGLVAGITQVNVQVPLMTYTSNQVNIALNSGQGILYIVR